MRVPAEAAGQRIDQWLASTLAPAFSRSRLQDLIRAGAVSVDGRTVREPKTKLAGGEIVHVCLPEPEAARPRAEAIALSVLHEDDDIIVVDKPAGLVVHPGAGNPEGTLVNALIHHCGDSLSGIGGVRRPGIVHRLDKETSGVMIVAKNDRAHRSLAEQFADHGRSGSLQRAYSAVTWGAPARANGRIDAPLGRAPGHRTKRAVVRPGAPDARHAVTHYRTVERFGATERAEAVAAMVECRLETGRTHQIRVHMAHIGHPLIGDRTYGASFLTKANTLPDDIADTVRAFPRQALHAGLLAVTHPASGEIMRFHAPLPADMEALVAALRHLDGKDPHGFGAVRS